MRTIVYVDGYNLYYGLLRKSPYKWLDLYTLFQNHVLSSSTEVIEVRYYTAPVKKDMSDDPESPRRQRIYLQALKKMPPCKVCIIEGSIESSKPRRRLVETIPERPDLTKVRVWQFSEKKTDVNLATDMLTAALTNACEQIVLCSNDSDLEGALAAICRHTDIQIGLVAPIPSDDHRKITTDLKKFSHWSKKLSVVHLENSQLPDVIPRQTKPIKKPQGW